MNNVKDRQDLVQIADDLKEHVLEVRRNEKNFLHFKNTEQFNNLRNTILTLTDLINSISKKNVKEMGEEDIQYKYNKDRLIEDLEERGYDIFRVLIKKDNSVLGNISPEHVLIYEYDIFDCGMSQIDFKLNL